MVGTEAQAQARQICTEVFGPHWYIDTQKSAETAAACSYNVINRKKKRMENYKKYYFIDFWQSSG